jgi:hypothetical protein
MERTGILLIRLGSGTIPAINYPQATNTRRLMGKVR